MGNKKIKDEWEKERKRKRKSKRKRKRKRESQREKGKKLRETGEGRRETGEGRRGRKISTCSKRVRCEYHTGTVSEDALRHLALGSTERVSSCHVGRRHTTR